LKIEDRSGISPVLATVILIAITLIAAIAIGGFVFGLFGSFTSTAQIEVSTVYLVHGPDGIGNSPPAADSTIMAINSGSANADANGVTITYGGQTCSATIHNGPITMMAGSSTSLELKAGSCTTSSSTGQAFSGSLSLSNGAQVPFLGNFQ